MAVTDPGDVSRFCRTVEAYLCRANGGHLVRLVGPSFDLVRRWAEAGVPIKVVFQGIDRYVQRAEEKGARRRPARIEFCEHDVDDAFEGWRRAVGVLARGVSAEGDADSSESDEERSHRRGPSLPVHLQRIQTRLSALLAAQRLPRELAAALDVTVRHLDGLHEAARTARGEKREQLLAALKAADRELITGAWALQPADATAALRKEAEADLSAFRHRLQADAWEDTVQTAAQRLLRERLGLPTLSLE